MDPPREVIASLDVGRDESSPHSDGGERLRYDFFSASCPSAERIIRSTVRELHATNSAVGPQLLRLASHDCFTGGCDASILLDSEARNRIKSENEGIPNLSLKGFEEIDIIKPKVEEECVGIVSCADIVALEAGGQFYPVSTGRLDSRKAFKDNATSELPGPDFNLVEAVRSFAAT